MANSVIARYPNTTSGRAKALGDLDRAGLDASALIEAGDELIVQQFNFAGDRKAAREAFGPDAIFTDHSKRPVSAADDAQDFPTQVTVGDVVIPVPAQAREGQPVPAEVAAGASAPPQDEGAPDTADAPSPHLSGAAQAQAASDKAKAADESSK